jgi:hypothetical protein
MTPFPRIPAGAEVAALVRAAGVRHCVVAVGYQRDLHGMTVTIGGRELSPEDWDAYDRMTGEIPLPAQRMADADVPESALAADRNESVFRCGKQCGSSRLFGGGIAFPQDLIDGGGAREPWVGFKRSIEQVDLMVAAYRDSCGVKLW